MIMKRIFGMCFDETKEIDVSGYKLDPKKLVFKEQNNNTKICFPDLEKKSDQIDELQLKINKLVKTKFIEVQTELYSNYRDIYRVITI